MTVIQGPLSVAEFRKNLGDAIGTVRFSKPGTSIEIQNRGVYWFRQQPRPYWKKSSGSLATTSLMKSAVWLLPTSRNKDPSPDKQPRSVKRCGVLLFSRQTCFIVVRYLR